jgi:SAM-dependent methyltransferase
MSVGAANLPSWLAALPAEGGCIHISDPRPYAHSEADYDAGYDSDPDNMRVGRGVIGLVRSRGGDMDGPALEIGCGSGLVSLGLAQAGAYPLTIISDLSPSFLGITRRKVRLHGLDESGLAYAVLRAEDMGRIPAAALSLIVMRSALHHVLDVDGFLAAAARALRPGGILAFQEPCLDGYVLMGAMIQFLPGLARVEGVGLTPAQEEKVRMFSRAMAYYARRDVDKSRAEDKHLFRPDEVMRAGARVGLDVEFIANKPFEAFEEPGANVPLDSFTPFFRGYAKFCMGWDEPLLDLFDRFILPHCPYVEETARGGSGPYMHGVFIACRRRGQP